MPGPSRYLPERVRHDGSTIVCGADTAHDVNRAREALELVRVGEGARLFGALEQLVGELRGAARGFDPEIRDPLRRAVRAMSSEKLRSIPTTSRSSL
eukprot:2256417-Rhodomonas_salina.2